MKYENEWIPNDKRKKLKEQERKEWGLDKPSPIVAKGICYDTIRYYD